MLSNQTEKNNSIEKFIERAVTQKLYLDPQWIKLGHYQKTMFGDWKSQADGENFFLSHQGKNDPKIELEKTLRGFFQEASDVADDHPICRFPARFLWLNNKLSIDPNLLPRTTCPDLRKFLKELNAQSVTLVFSSYYLNNPSSAFGHTLLRINKTPRSESDKHHELLDYGINYAAVPDTYFAPIYAFKGLTGFFKGTFQRIPYYYKVREYNDFESRDLWEYDLALTPQQLLMLTLHLWELGHTYFDYFYLTENCSYHILSLIEVANPELKLTETLKFPVIPADTVKALFNQPNLIADIHYRPSLRTQFLERIKKIDENKKSFVVKLAKNPDLSLPSSISEQEKIEILDASLDLVDFQYAEELLKKPEGKGQKNKYELMKKRAALLKPSKPLALKPPKNKMIHNGHGSWRIGTGYGYENIDKNFIALDLRLSLHDLVDPVEGYSDFFQLEFFNTRMRLFIENKNVELTELDLVHIVSLTPLSPFDLSPSWKFSLGTRTLYDGSCNACMAGVTELGGGATMAFFDNAIITFVLLDTTLLGSPEFHEFGDLPLRAGFGSFGGLRFRINDSLILLIKGESLFFPTQDKNHIWKVQPVLRWEFMKNIAFNLEGKKSNTEWEGRALFYYYF